MITTGRCPHVRGHLPGGDYPASGALLRLRHVLRDLRRRRRLDVGDLVAALRRDRRPGQVRAAPAAGQRRAVEVSSGSSTRLIVIPGSPGCLPGRRFPRSRSDLSLPFSLYGLSEEADAMMWRVLAGLPLQLLHPGRQALYLRSQLPGLRGQLSDQPVRLRQPHCQLSSRESGQLLRRRNTRHTGHTWQ